MVAALTFVAIGLLAYGVISRRTENTVLTAPMFFVTYGLVVHWTFGAHHPVDEHAEWIKFLAEITLVVILFTDASRIGIKRLRREHDLPVRMLGIGLPLTMAAGAGLALLLFPSMSVWEALLIGAILAPTDAALGQTVVESKAVPLRIRQALNVESGLNDGIAFPVVLIAMCAADAAHRADVSTAYWVQFTLLQVTLGPLVGAAVGWGGGRVVVWAVQAEWMSQTFERLSVLGIAILAYAGATLVGGNGFIAAFVAGLALGNTAAPGVRRCLIDFGATEGQLLSLTTFMVFGAVLAPVALEHFEPVMLLYAVLSLTAVRFVPVWISTLGEHLQGATLAFLAWFGPRGIASILYALIVVEETELPVTNVLTAIVATTVLLSVYAHGFTAAPAAKRYAATAMPDDSPEMRPVEELPLRTGTRPEQEQ